MFRLGQQCRFVASIPTKPQLDWQFLSNPANMEAIRRNIQQRKSQASIKEVQDLYKQIYLNTCSIHTGGQSRTEEYLLKAALEVPNMCPQEVSDLGTEIGVNDTPVFLLNEYIVELNPANFNILNQILN